MLCDFLAAIACAMQRFQNRVQRNVRYIVSAILKSRKKGKRPIIPKPVVSIAAKAGVDALTNLLENLPPARQFNDVLRAIRILAISVCPAPEQHETVALCCLSPLEVYVLSGAIKQELKDELPRGWATRS
jgi:hypothetical protein